LRNRWFRWAFFPQGPLALVSTPSAEQSFWQSAFWVEGFWVNLFWVPEE
jgi:hypothetical protein